MRFTFYQFKQLFLESLLNEDKSRLIDRLVLPDIENEEDKQKARDEMKAFFKKYNTWENKLDWNKLKTITYADFENIKNQAEQTKGAQKREIKDDIKAIFKSVGERQFKIMGENDSWLFVSPQTYEAAVYCDSSENQGAGATWCIGYDQDSGYWDRYTDNGSLFIMAFNKNYKLMTPRELRRNLKYMFEFTNRKGINVWNQADTRSSFKNGDFGLSQNELKGMFLKLKAEKDAEYAEKMRVKKMPLKARIENLKNLNAIPDSYFETLKYSDKKKFTSIDIPDNIKAIGKSAFSGCYISSVNIPNSVTSIGRKAFYYCDFPTIKLPKYLEIISKEAFLGCSLETVDIPRNIKIIGELAFAACRYLKEVTLHNGLTTIGPGAFQECSELRALTIPKTVTEIGEYAFLYCNKLKEIVFEGRTLEEVQEMKNFTKWKPNIKRLMKAGI